MKSFCYLASVVCLLMMSCNNKVVQKDPIPEHDHFEMVSQQVGETRVINVWTPPGYANDETSFPVLYMPDGGIKEDFPHIANTLNNLITNKQIPPFILVGIENIDRRRDLTGASSVKADEKYCPLTDGATNFRNFITQELRPAIQKKYRTTDYSGLLGESLAGLFVVETFFQEASSFDCYIAMDPSLWWNGQYLVKNATELLSNLPDKKLKLWFAGSGAEDINQYTEELAAILEQHQLAQLTWRYSDEPNEQHHTIFRATKEKAFKWALNE